MLPQPIFGIRCKMLCSTSLCACTITIRYVCLLAWLFWLVGGASNLSSHSLRAALAMVLYQSLISLQFSLKLSIDKNRIILTKSECFFLLRLLLLLLLFLNHTWLTMSLTTGTQRGSQWRRNSALVVLSVVVASDKFLECQLDFQVHVSIVHQVFRVAFFITET